MQFTGEYLDPTGLYHLRARQYDPQLGRFLSRDPLEPQRDAPYVSVYAYVNDYPTVAKDPSGQCFLVCAVVGAAIGEGTYLYHVGTGSESFSVRGAAVAAGKGFIAGAVGGVVGEEAAGIVGRFVPGLTGRVIGAAIGGGFGGAAATETASVLSGCGLATRNQLGEGALTGAAGDAFGERFFGQVGFRVRKVRSLLHLDRRNTQRVWMASIATATVTGSGGGEGDNCK
jgi:RHS repeat-associated protein